ncbi:phosphoribosylanthranilate isomerase [Caldisphaera sp.]|uniref:phosphoribosylanthranilate isomerase n=1 Tax=Caldisphaera sp. TaxID=2060322 RepID=UPI0025C188CF|nr:phosphoribosylanthranilate isomerase [Caldisphaera sp.]
MGNKLKICGVKYIEDIVSLNKVGVDFIGMINDKVSPRYVDKETIINAVKFSNKPIVTVKVNDNIEEIMNSPTNYVQIHRLLSDYELNQIRSYNKKVILYVPADFSYINYLKKAVNYTDMILLDSPIKGQRINKEIVKEMLDYLPNAGIGGGINLNNIKEFVELNPGWFDISSGVEKEIGKKDIDLVKKIIEVINNG